ncbi:helix-turn-helix domain-containing protein, partial [Nonomuraea sp. NPDC059194]|uniref:helix-turn-helix domain-containing protein n=1 Tax=Nonomuraea sp. NPDC059194 TaxID=3346764 RepID=UPI00367C14E4
MKLRYNYRLYPDAPQRELLARTFGCVRGVERRARTAQSRVEGRPDPDQRHGVAEDLHHRRETDRRA